MTKSEQENTSNRTMEIIKNRNCLQINHQHRSSHDENAHPKSENPQSNRLQRLNVTRRMSRKIIVGDERGYRLAHRETSKKISDKCWVISGQLRHRWRV